MDQDSTRLNCKVTSTSCANAHRRLQSLYLVCSSLLALSVAASAGVAQAGGALPTGGQFVAGQGAISGTANGMVINQSTSRGIIDWQSFSIAQGKSVQIDNGAGATLNRVTGGNVSSIAGSLSSTGSVYVINSAGVIVMPTGSVVTTGGFVASTRDVPNGAFMAGGTQPLTGSSTGTVVNQGSITASNGDVVLVGKSVTNNGQINAPNGAAELAAGDNVLLQPGSSQAVLINAGSGDVTNTGNIDAAQVELNAAGGNVYALATSNGGIIRATGTATKDGHVFLTAGGNVTVDGSVSATNADGSGGTITATGSGASGNITVAGTVSANATGAAAKGGRVTLTAAGVNVGSTAKISADGGSNGGMVFLGGDRHGGTDPSIALSSTKIANAKQTTIAAGAQISANGGASGGAGQGGDVIVWSDQSTSYAGHISAQGGHKGGNGGFVEVSGEHLAFTGRVSTLARLGKEGELLLDPSDVNIVAAPGTTTNETTSTSGGTTTYTPNGAGPAVSTILNTDIIAALGSTDVTITTSNIAGTGTGNITLSAPINWDMGAIKGDHSLTLNAAGNIVFAAGTTAAIDTGGAGNITLIAAGAGVVAGGTVIQVGGPISANGGTISLISTTPGYRVVVSNGITVSNTQAMGSGEVIFEADRVRLGNLANPQGFVTTPGTVVVEPTSSGAIQVGNNNTLTGSSTSFTNDTTLINQESIANITADTLVIGSAGVTSLTLTTPTINPTAISATGVKNLELLTGSGGSVTQDGNTPLSVGASGSGGLAISTGTIDLPLANAAGAIAFQAQGNIVFQGQSAPGSSGTLQIGAPGGGAIAGISGITTSGSATVTLINSGSVTQDTDVGNTINTQNLVLEGSGGFTLNNTANSIANIAGTLGALSLNDNAPLTIASLSDHQDKPTTLNGLTGAGAVTVVDNGVLTIASGAPVTDTGDVRLETANAFVNQDGANAFNVTGGTWRVYSQDPTKDTKGGLGSAQYNFVQYGAANSYADPFATANAALNPAATGNGFLYTVSPTVSESLVGTFTKVYDGTTLVVPALAGGDYSGVSGAINGDAVVLSHPTIGNYDNRNVGTGKTITVTGISLVSAQDGNGVQVFGYDVVGSTTATGTITPALLTITATTDTKSYDGTTSALPTPTVTGLQTGDGISGLSETFLSPHVMGPNGSTLAVNPGFTVNDGNGGNNYTVVVNTAPGTITAAALTISAVTDTKTYDGTTISTLTPTFTGLQAGDTLSNLSQSFTSKDVLGANGSTLVVNSGYVLSNASDYAVTVKTALGTINPALLTVTATPNTKTYDGTTTAAALPTITSGKLFGTDTGNFIETYSSKNAGSGLTLTPSGAVNDGNGGNDYIVTFVPIAAGVINKALLTISALTDTKVYDGTTSSNKTPTYTGLQTGDLLSNLSQAFTSPNVMGANGSTLVVNPGYVLSDGNGGNNYNVVLQSALGTITPLAVAVVLHGTRAYDGSTDASASILTITNNHDGSNLILSGTGVLASRNVGDEALLSQGGALEGFTLGGSAAGNYTLVGGNGDVIVTPLAITVTAVANTKTFDGTPNAAGTPIITSGSLVGGDTGSFIETYNTIHAGSGLTLTPSGTVNDGNGGSNYTITFVPIATGVINPEALTISAVTDTKVYDGTMTSIGTPILTFGTLFNGDTLTNLSQSFTSKDVLGTNGSTLVVNPGYVLTDASDYAVTLQSALGTITPALLTVTAVSTTKTYDGTDSSSGTPSITSGKLYGSDTGSFVQTYNTIHAGVGLTLTPSGTVNDGNGGKDYSITFVPVSTGAINPEAITIAAVSDSKVYDGTVASAGTPILASGTLYNGDTLTNLSQSFTSKDVRGANGSTLLVNPGYVLTDASDYSVALKSAPGTIMPALLTVTATANTKTYDGTTTAAAAPVISKGQLYGTDTGNFVETYSTKNAGAGLTLTPSGTVNDGNGGADYSVTFVPITTGVINKALLTISAVTDTKAYDGTTASGLTPTAAGLQTGDTLSNLSQSFDSKDVKGTDGSTLSVNPGYVLTDASDYNVTLVTAPGTITPALLTVSAVPTTKTYDGTGTSPGTPVITSGQLYGTDTGSFTQTYGTVHAGTGLTLTPSGTIADGNGGKDYTVTYVPITTGVIDPLPIVVTGTRVYDGATDAASGILTITNVLPGDTVNVVSGTGVLASRNAGTEALTSFGTLTLGGASANDYTVVGGSGSVLVTPLAITITAVGSTKVYDGTDTSPGTPVITSGRLVSGDTGSFTETYGSPNAGTGIVLTPGGTVNDGNGGNNYTVTFVDAAGTIDQRPVVLTGIRPFDGTTAAPGSILTVVNNIDGKNLTISGTGTLVSPAVGNEAITAFGTLMLGGSAARNYTFVGGSGSVLVTPIPATVNIATRYDQTVAGMGLDPYVDRNSIDGILLPEPGQSGLGACFIESWYIADDGRPRPICRWTGSDFRGAILGPRGRLDTSGYLITAAVFEPPPQSSIERSHALYRQLRNK